MKLFHSAAESSERHMLGWVLFGWTSLSILVWLGIARLWISSEQNCDESTTACFEPPQIWVTTGIFVGVIWLVGLVVLTLAVASRRKANAPAQPADEARNGEGDAESL